MFEIIRRIWRTGVVTQAPLLEAAPKRYRGKLSFQQVGCTGCGSCADVCPAGAIRIQPETAGHAIEVSYGKCIFCGLCAEVCPADIISLSQDYHLATKVKAELLQTAMVRRQ